MDDEISRNKLFRFLVHNEYRLNMFWFSKLISVLNWLYFWVELFDAICGILLIPMWLPGFNSLSMTVLVDISILQCKRAQRLKCKIKEL